MATHEESRKEKIDVLYNLSGLSADVNQMARAYKCTDPPLTLNSDRQNCNFRALTSLWTFNNAVHYETVRAVQHFDSSLIQVTVGGSIESESVYGIPREKILENLSDDIEAEQVKAQKIMVDILDPIMKYRNAN